MKGVRADRMKSGGMLMWLFIILYSRSLAYARLFERVGSLRGERCSHKTIDVCRVLDSFKKREGVPIQRNNR